MRTARGLRSGTHHGSESPSQVINAGPDMAGLKRLLELRHRA